MISYLWFIDFAIHFVYAMYWLVMWHIFAKDAVHASYSLPAADVTYWATRMPVFSVKRCRCECDFFDMGLIKSFSSTETEPMESVPSHILDPNFDPPIQKKGDCWRKKK